MNHVSMIYRRLGPELADLGVILVYPRARYGHWWLYPKEFVWPVRLFAYAPGVWRIVTSTTGWDARRHRIRADMLAKLPPDSPHIEVTFAPPELSVIVEWVVKHLEQPLQGLPRWVADKYESEVVIGAPLRGRVWSINGKRAFTSNRESGGAREKERHAWPVLLH